MTRDTDQLAGARGIAWGLALSIPLWIAILLLVGLTNG
jgi:hypothetical protein